MKLRSLNGLRRVTHFLLYVVVLSMISTGLGVVIMAKLFPVLYGAGGTLPRDFEEFPPLEGHEFFAGVLMILIALHAAGVLYHELRLRDRLLTRMGFGRPRGEASAVRVQAGSPP